MLESLRRAINTLTDVMIANAAKPVGLRVTCTPTRITAIKRTVAAHFGYAVADVFRRTREADLVWPRHVTWFLCRQLTAAKWKSLARAFRCDHTTIIHGVNSVRGQISVNRSRLAEVNELTEIVTKRIGGKQ